MRQPDLDPTAYPDVNQLLNELLVGVQTTLGEQFVGLYLYGSLALGDFNPQSSDIDFVVVTGRELSDSLVSALRTRHERLASRRPRWARELEGSYIPQSDLRRYDPARARHPHIFEGRLLVEQHGTHWVIERHVLREYGLVVAGPPPRTLIDPVPSGELRRAVMDLVRSWWAPMVDDPVRLYDQAYRVYAIATMCRVLYTLQHGAIVSKPAATRWAQEELGERWRACAQRSLAGRSGSEEQLVAETRDFIRYAVAECERAARCTGGS